MRLIALTEIKMKIKITEELMKYLRLNHAGQHCPKYWVLSRCTAQLNIRLFCSDLDRTMTISEYEMDNIPDRYLELC